MAYPWHEGGRDTVGAVAKGERIQAMFFLYPILFAIRKLGLQLLILSCFGQHWLRVRMKAVQNVPTECKITTVPQNMANVRVK